MAELVKDALDPCASRSGPCAAHGAHDQVEWGNHDPECAHDHEGDDPEWEHDADEDDRQGEDDQAREDREEDDEDGNASAGEGCGTDCNVVATWTTAWTNAWTTAWRRAALPTRIRKLAEDRWLVVSGRGEVR